MRCSSWLVSCCVGLVGWLFAKAVWWNGWLVAPPPPWLSAGMEFLAICMRYYYYLSVTTYWLTTITTINTTTATISILNFTLLLLLLVNGRCKPCDIWQHAAFRFQKVHWLQKVSLWLQCLSKHASHQSFHCYSIQTLQYELSPFTKGTNSNHQRKQLWYWGPQQN